MKNYFETFRIGAAASGRPIPDGELVWRGHMPRPRGARRESSPSHLHERRRLGSQGEGQGVLRRKHIKLEAVVSRNPREHWLKPLFSKNEVAKSGPAFHSNGNPERGFGIYVARNINIIMLRPNYVAYKSFFAEFLRNSPFQPRGTQHNSGSIS